MAEEWLTLFLRQKDKYRFFLSLKKTKLNIGKIIMKKAKGKKYKIIASC